MENTINQRVGLAIENSPNKSVNSFAKRIGVPQATLSFCVNGQREPRASLLMSVLNGLPDLSAEWLMRGEGSMWKGDVNISGDQKAGDGSVLVGHGSEVGSIANNGASALSQQENERLRAELKSEKEKVVMLERDNAFLKEQLNKALEVAAASMKK